VPIALNQILPKKNTLWKCFNGFITKIWQRNYSNDWKWLKSLKGLFQFYSNKCQSLLNQILPKKNTLWKCFNGFITKIWQRNYSNNWKWLKSLKGLSRFYSNKCQSPLNQILPKKNTLWKCFNGFITKIWQRNCSNDWKWLKSLKRLFRFYSKYCQSLLH
jgi:hypothetical protein